jgi:hypothetical protein
MRQRIAEVILAGDDPVRPHRLVGNGDELDRVEIRHPASRHAVGLLVPRRVVVVAHHA